MKLWFSLVLFGVLVDVGFGVRGFLASLPNVANVFDCDGIAYEAIGHIDRDGGGQRNAFGEDFGRYGTWLPELCALDSDGDNMTNGEELGDPDCVWEPGMDGILTEVLGHPGINCGSAPDLTPAVWAHGMLMLSAWVVFAPIGIMMAMCNKTKASPTVEKWFQLHQAFLTTTVFLTLIAFVVIWNANGFSLYDPHTKIGFTVVIFAILQPINGVFRAKKDSPKSTLRVAWEYGHQWFGRISVIFAIAASVLGLRKVGPVLEAQEVTDGVGYAIIALFVAGSVASFAYVLLIRVDSKNKPEPRHETRELVKSESPKAEDQGEFREIALT